MANYLKLTAPATVEVDGDSHTFAAGDLVDPASEFYPSLAAVPGLLVDSGTALPTPPPSTPAPASHSTPTIVSSAAPPSPSFDTVWLDESTNTLKRWDGTAWRARTTTVGDRARRAAAAARGRNSLELAVMTSPPTITASTTNPDATLTHNYYVNEGQGANFKYRGGTPEVYFTTYDRFPVVTLPTGTGNADATHNALGWAVEFYTDAPKVLVFALNSGSPNGLAFEVDGQAAAAAPTGFPATSGSGYFLLDFTTAGGSAVRRIRVEGDQASGIRGVQVGPTYGVWAPADADPILVASVGDSVSAQTGVTKPNGGWNIGLGKLLGWTDVRQIALGGTGWINQGSYASTFADASRIADVKAVNPDLLIVTGSTNDGSYSQSAITSAVLAGLKAYRTALPSVPIILGGVWPGASGPSSTYQNVETAVKAAFDQWGDANSYYVPITNDPTGSWVFGTGHVGATNGSGNSDYYVNSVDAVHPSQAGHDYYAKRWAAALRASVLPNLA